MAKKMLKETAASDTIVAKPTPETSRAAMMLDVMNLFQHMDADKMTEALATMQNLSAPTDGMAAGNQASIQTGNKGKPIPTQAMKEEITALFGSQDLSEEFVNKATTILEATVNAKLIAETARIEEEYAAKLEEQVEETIGTIVEHVDKYLSLAAEEWLEENKVAVDNTLRAEIAEDFIGGLHKLFAEHYMTVPDSKVDVVEALTDRVAELEEQVNKMTDEKIEMAEVLEQYAQQEIFDEVSEGLAMTQVDKLRTLTEGVQFDGDVDSYKSKLVIIKEHHFAPKATKQDFEAPGQTPEQLNEESLATSDPQMRSYIDAISRTIKK